MTKTLLALGVTAAVPANAREPGSRQTREFVQAAAQSDTFEMMEATTVLAQSDNPTVRAFAQEMITAHGQTSAALSQAVAKAGLKQPSPGMDGGQAMFLASLQSQRGADFDKTYITQQVLAHHAALTTAQGYAAAGDDPAFRQVAAETVAIITAHLAMAEQMQAMP